MDQKDMFPGPRISRVTLGRLHNLGNYEHVRYEVTVDLPPGTSPAKVIAELEDTLNKLQPKRRYDPWTVANAMKMLRELETAGGVRDEADERNWAHWTEIVKIHEAQQAQHQEALAAFDQFGGTKVFTDAKENWDEGY
jgi:hypothetical protein